MAFNSIDNISNTGFQQAEQNSSDSALFRDAENKIRILNGFLVTGDLASDYNYFLNITQRNINYKKATSESPEELIKNLEGIQSSLLEIQSEKINDINASDAAKMFYVDLPEAEIKVITKLIESYK